MHTHSEDVFRTLQAAEEAASRGHIIMFWFNSYAWEWGWDCYTCDENERTYDRWVDGTRPSTLIEKHHEERAAEAG